MKKDIIDIIKTSAYVKKSIRKKFKEACGLTGLDVSGLFIKLMMYCISEMRKHVAPCPWRSVYYQESDPDADWSCLKVKLTGKEYEYMADIRKVYRTSVSACFAHAVEEYLDKLVDILTGKTVSRKDNYLNVGYIFLGQKLKTSFRWSFYWGIPHDLAKNDLIQDNSL